MTAFLQCNSTWPENLSYMPSTPKEISNNTCIFNSVQNSLFFSNVMKKGYYDLLWEKQTGRLNKYQELYPLIH